MSKTEDSYKLAYTDSLLVVGEYKLAYTDSLLVVAESKKS